MTKSQEPKIAGTSVTAKVFGYAGMLAYMYFGIYKGHEVSELFIVLITLLIVGGDVAVKIMEARK